MLDKLFLKQKSKTMGFEMSEEQLQKFDLYAKLLVEWNEKINLTAIIKPEEITIKHFIDSIMLLNHLPKEKQFSLIDIGAGAGFPSIPCKMLNEKINLTLFDSLNKRVNFLELLSNELEIDVICKHARAEEVAHELEFREKYEFATARAVANLRDLCEYCLPYVKVSGKFIALKGYDIEEELEESKNAIKLLGGEIADVVKYSLPDESKRAIVVINKISQTPTKFPRNRGKMKKQPL